MTTHKLSLACYWILVFHQELVNIKQLQQFVIFIINNSLQLCYKHCNFLLYTEPHSPADCLFPPLIWNQIPIPITHPYPFCFDKNRIYEINYVCNSLSTKYCRRNICTRCNRKFELTYRCYWRQGWEARIVSGSIGGGLLSKSLQHYMEMYM